MSVKTEPNVQVNPLRAGVSLIPLDDFSSVDTTANNLAHMVRSKEAGLRLTQERGDQELPYQVNAIKQGAEISRIGNLDWDKELKHWVRRKPRGMAQMRVDVKVLVEDQKFWHPNKGLENYWVGNDCKPGKVSQMKSVPDTGWLC